MDKLTASADDFELIEPLNERELEILTLFAEHRTNQDIADALVLSLNTIKWYARQIYGKLGVANRREAVARAGQLGLLDEFQSVTDPLPHNLPAALTSFVGRETELGELRNLLLDPGCRLLTITGPGGMGKTRLALEIAYSLAQDPGSPFTDGVFLAPLVDRNDTDSTVAAVANAVDFRFYQASDSPEQQLSQFLRQKNMLLILDNFEQLTHLEPLTFLAGLLAATAGVTTLVTSRVRLNIQGEQVYPLHGLDVPKTEESGKLETAGASGVKLFVEVARRASPTFVFNSTNRHAVVAICRLVDGMPLAIELAAAWVAVLEPGEILSEIRSGLDFLATDAANVPVRQRSLPVVLDASWQLLGEAERTAVRKISVFRGGFSGEAARAVVGMSPGVLLALVGKSWLQRDAGGRYSVLELLRQYGAEKLEEDAIQERDARTQHSLYFCRWLAGPEVDLRGRYQVARLKAIALELDNVLSACFWAASRGDCETLDGAIETLGLYYRWQGGYVSGDRTLARLIGELADVSDESCQHALAQMLTWRCAYRGLMGDRDTSRRLAEETLALLASPALHERETRDLHAHIELQLGYVDLIADAAEAEPHFTQSYRLYQQVDDNTGMAFALVGLGRTRRNLYDFDGAEAAFRPALRLHEEAENQLGYSDALTSLGSLFVWRTQFDEAERLLRQSMSVAMPFDADSEGHSLYWLAWTFHDSGRFAEAAAAMDHCLRLRRERGMQLFVILTAVRCGIIYRDMGDWSKAREFGNEALAKARAVNYHPGNGQALTLLGSIDLLEEEFRLADERLKEGFTIQLMAKDVPGNMAAQAWLSFAARALNRHDEAWRYALAELDRALRTRLYLPLLSALAGLALLLVDEGNGQQAVELYALLLEHPYTVNAHWMSEIITPEIRTAALSLGEALRSEAEETGKALNVWEVAAALAEDLGGRGEADLRNFSQIHHLVAIDRDKLMLFVVFSVALGSSAHA